MADSSNTAIGFMIIVFIFQLIIIWYLWWIYSQVQNNYDDLEDMVLEIYTLDVAESKRQGLDTSIKVPKRVRSRIAKRSEKK